MVTSQFTDRASLKWLRQRYTVYGFRFHGSLPGREIANKTDDIETGGGSWYSHHVLTTAWYCWYWASNSTEYFCWSPNPSPDT